MAEWLERNRGHILVTLINLALMGGMFFWLQRPVSTPLEIVPPGLTPAPVITPSAQPPLGTATAAPLRVYVTGAVLHTGVYRLPPGSIVQDALQAAGGPSPEADLNRINLAQELRDQQQVTVPRAGEPAAPPPTGGEGPPGQAGAPAAKVNINSAAVEELDTLPGIGPAMAQAIVDYRTANGPFKSIEEIKLVTGIGEATYQKLKDLIAVGN